MLIDPLTDPRWTELVEASPETLIFHHPRWLELLHVAYGHELTAVCVERDGAVVAGLPLAHLRARVGRGRLVALPFSDLCPPLAREASLGEPLARALDEHRRETGASLEVREAFDELLGGASVPLFHLHTLDLTGEAKFSSMTRRNVNKARRAGVTVERRTDRAALDAFYAMHLQTRRRQGVPTQPRGFIRSFERLFEAGLGFVALASVEGAPAAAAVFVGAGRTLTYKFGSSDRSTLTARPNNLLFAEAIGWAREAGYSRLDFGRTDFGHDGLRSFKASWGAEERTLSYTYAGRAPASPDPGFALRALGVVIRRSPPVVGRALGAALYRHAA
jgi:CelD/BcsL family acetyltransferase involved in cellulose biosynthesis